MYGKLFAQMYDGTLATHGPWQALVTFQQMIVLADRQGYVDMTPDAISRRTSIPLEIITTGIAALLKPDPSSRSPAEDGRRLVPIDDGRDWGWQIVNYSKYRQMRSADERREYLREAQASRRERLKAMSTNVNMSTASTQCQQSQPIADADADADADAKAEADAEVPSVPSLRSGTGRKRPSDPMSDAVWGEGTALLGEAKDARSFLGKLCKEYGQRLVLQAISDAQSAIPAEPRAWLVARCQERRAISGNRQVALEERNAAIAANWHPPEDE